MSKRIKGGLGGLLSVLAVSLIATGCMPRGGVTNPGWTVVAATDQAVYAVQATGQVVALNAENGDKLWGYPVTVQSGGGGFLGGLFGGGSAPAETPLNAVYGSPVLTDDLVVAASYDGHVYAFDRASGQESWVFAAQGPIIGGVTLVDGVVYVGSSDHMVYAVDVNTGKSVWPQPFTTENWVWGAPAVDATRVYVGSMDHRVYAVNRQTGEQEWQRDLGAAIPNAVMLSGDALFVAAVDKRLYALKAEDGTDLWAPRSLEHWAWGKPLAYDGYVYVGSLDGKIHGFAIADGSPRWDAVTLDGSVPSSPALFEGNLLVGTQSGTLFKIDVQTGQSAALFGAAQSQTVGSLLSTPAAVGQMVYVGTTTDSVYALDTSRSGDLQLWVYPQPK